MGQQEQQEVKQWQEEVEKEEGDVEEEGLQETSAKNDVEEDQEQIIQRQIP